MQELIYEFQALQEARHRQKLNQMQALISDFEVESTRLRRGRFNTFSLLNVQTDEVRHSQFLAWLLEAKASHGQGKLFMQSFIDCCQLKQPPNALQQYYVHTEHAGLESIIDIMVYRPRSFLIYIENKVLAVEGPNQIDREYRDLNRIAKVLGVPARNRYAIFLTPTGRLPTSGDASHWQSLAYGQLADAFRNLLSHIAVPKVKFIVSDWLDTIETFGGFYEPVQ